MRWCVAIENHLTTPPIWHCSIPTTHYHLTVPSMEHAASASQRCNRICSLHAAKVRVTPLFSHLTVAHRMAVGESSEPSRRVAFMLSMQV
uniref:Uncharacterized protein n=1 Tax=Ascaris lumbricoides TaxID=6252 RepID=A0A0M3HNG5_ASCLU